ncbi:CotH protein [Enhygromyxa salina]|uniref:CotH protein n=1 Tax=Enhygromyxa salina TaxID=215803 RepID=A0A2S9YB32_9BACT|nr:CotH kinase family protein [Enhygromyxa salina]PRQ02327.1 CotH protein [Enhygromyxa salina]
MSVRFTRALATVLLACVASGCDEPGPEPDKPDADELGVCELPVERTALDVDCAAIARIVPTGVAVSEGHVARRHLRLEDASGAALGAEFGACLIVADSECERAAVEIEPAPSHSNTALLVRPMPEPVSNAVLAEAVSNFIDSRPEGEAISVFRWGAELTQISTPTTDRRRLHALVASGLQPLPGEALPLTEAIDAVATPLALVEAGSHLSHRQLVVVAPGHAPVEASALERSGLTAALDVELVTAAGFDDALAELSARLDATLAAGEQVIRQCALDGLRDLSVHVANGGPTLALTDVSVLGAAEAGEDLACSPADQALEPALPEVIEIELSPSQRLEYDSRVAELSKEPFRGSVRTNLNAPGVLAPAKLKLRGNGSLECDRKSFSLNFEDDLPRRWLPDSGTDKFFLLSMCLDNRYVNQFTANQLMAELGLFGPKFRMVELVLSGQSQGLYLLVEKPQTALVDDNTRVRLIVRRGPDAEGAAPELKHSAGPDDEALATYEALITEAEARHGDELLAYLEGTMDLNQYLRWLALMSLLQSGDFVDEVYFMSTEVTGPGASAEDYFSISTWDQDDIFKPCHNGGDFEMDDPDGLLYCAEGLLDYAIFADPTIYARYVDELERTLAWLDQATFDRATFASEDSVLDILARDDARAAMVELLDDNPAAISYEVTEQEVRGRGAQLRELFAARRALLSERISHYRESEQ